MNSFEAIVFFLHYFIFLLAVIFFLLKFHKKEKLKYIFYISAALWILFGTIDFFIGFGRLIEYIKTMF